MKKSRPTYRGRDKLPDRRKFLESSMPIFGARFPTTGMHPAHRPPFSALPHSILIPSTVPPALCSPSRCTAILSFSLFLFLWPSRAVGASCAAAVPLPRVRSPRDLHVFFRRAVRLLRAVHHHGLPHVRDSRAERSLRTLASVRGSLR